MSGGPVFNEAGHVIGLVSYGGEAAVPPYSNAVWFGGWTLYENLMYWLDPSNPGMLQGWGIIDEEKNIQYFDISRSPAKVIRQAKKLGLDKIARISLGYEPSSRILQQMPIASLEKKYPTP
jgi:serine protease Do